MQIRCDIIFSALQIQITGHLEFSKRNAAEEFNESETSKIIISNQVGLLSHDRVCVFSLYVQLLTGVNK